MAILPMTAELLTGLVFDQAIGGRCLELARQDVRLTRAEFAQIIERVGRGKPTRGAAAAAALGRMRELPSPARGDPPVCDRQFFRVLGFEDTVSVDASDFEQASCIHDMNTPGLTAKLPGPVDLAVETGTAEHVFHLPQYLRNVCESLRTGGVAVHFVPAHNYMDHGFYQFSPTLFFDFYAANRFDLLDLVLIETDTEDWSRWSISRYQPGEFDRRDRLRFRDRYVTLGVVARKRADSTSDVIPQQRIYGSSDEWRALSAEELLASSQDLGALQGPFVHDTGFCWRAPVPPQAGDGDCVALSTRSRLLLSEEGRVLGPAHAAHQHIRGEGRGGYSHWGAELLFSTSDNSDPNSNGRRYRLHARPGHAIAGVLPVTGRRDDDVAGAAPAVPAQRRRGLVGALRGWVTAGRR